MRTLRLFFSALVLSGFAFQALAQGVAPDAFSFALERYREGQFRIAYTLFDEYRARYADAVNALDAEYLAAECLYQQGYLTDAIARFARLREEHPRTSLSDNAMFRQGESLFRLQRYAAAYDVFASLLREYPEGDKAHEAAWWAGEAAFKRDDYASAQRMYALAYDMHANGVLRDRALFSIGSLKERRGRCDEARESYETLLADFPASDLCPSARTRIAACLSKQKAHVDALAWLEKLSDSPDPGNAAERLAIRTETQYQLGRYTESEKLASTFLAAYPAHARARSVRYTLGWSCLEQKKYTEAAAAFDAVSTGSDALARAAMYRKGQVLRLDGKREAANTVLEALVAASATGPYADNALFELGMNAFEQERYAEALRRFEQVPLSYPGSDVLADAWFMAGETKMRMGKTAEAAAMFLAAAEVKDSTGVTERNALFRMGEAYYESRQFTRASEAFATFAKRFPADVRAADAQLWQGESAYAAARYNAAADAYAQAATANDARVRYDAIYGRAWSLYKLGRFADAEPLFRRLTEEFKGQREDMDANVRLGDAQYAQKKWSDASRAYRYAVRMYPKHALVPYAMLQLGNAEQREGDTPAGIGTLRALLADHPASPQAPEARLCIARMYHKGGDFSTAIAEYRALQDMHPLPSLEVEAGLGIGECLYLLKKYKDARQAYQAVVDAHPESPLLADALDGMARCLAKEGDKEGAASLRPQWLREHPRSRAAEAVAFGELSAPATSHTPRQTITLGRAFLQQFPASPRGADARLLVASACRAEKAYDSARLFLAPLRGTAYESDADVELASIAIDEQDAPEAISIYSKLLLRGDAVRPQTEVLWLRGKAYLTDGNADEARQDFQHAMDIGGNARHAALSCIELCKLDCREQRMDSGLARLAALAASRRDDVGAQAQFAIGSILADAGRNDEAVPALQRVRSTFPASAEWVAQSLLALGSVYEHEGSTAQAKECYTTLRTNYPASDAAAEAQRRLRRFE